MIIRFIQIGSASAPVFDMPAAALRSSSLVLMGSGLGSVRLDRLVASIAGVLGAARKAGLTLAHREAPLSKVQATWSGTDDPRLVLTP